MLPTYKRILYATDLSQSARTAFQHAVAVADTYNAKIHLVHVFSETTSAQAHYFNSMASMHSFSGIEVPTKEEFIAKIETRLDLFAQEEMPNGKKNLDFLSGIDIVEGSASSGIIKMSKELNADLIVMGNHGKGVLQYAFLGSVAEKVLLEADCPVLVVPLAA